MNEYCPEYCLYGKKIVVRIYCMGNHIWGKRTPLILIPKHKSAKWCSMYNIVSFFYDRKIVLTFKFFFSLPAINMGIFFFRERFWGNFWNMVNIFTCRRPNRSGVGAIDSLDLFEQVLDQRCIPEVSEKIFTHDISMIRRQKMVIFGVLKVFISNFTYYNLYWKETQCSCAEEVSTVV